MKRVLQIVMLSVLGTVVVLVVMGLILPNHYRVERSILIDAPPAAVHPWIDDLRRWPTWANWNRAADTTLEYSGTSQGVGAQEIWRDQRRGTGTITITRSDSAHGVWFTTELGDGTVGGGSLTYAESAGTTTVTWTDEGRLPKIVGGFVRGHFQDVLGEHFEEGLRRLKQVVEREKAEL